jgi:DNA-nicking Smr family endonuclease
MSKKTRLKPEDLEAFTQAVQGIKPLVQRKVKLEPPRKKSKPKQVVSDQPDSFLDGSEPRDTVQANDFIAYNETGVSHKTLRNLKKGQYNIEAVLDLHRKTIEEARAAVDEFLHKCVRHAVKVALIVHGKGRMDSPPILKNQINHWLRQASPVLAFCSAAPRHGGNGAVYVLLRSQKQEKFS